MSLKGSTGIEMGELAIEIHGTKIRTHERITEFRRTRMTDYVDLHDALDVSGGRCGRCSSDLPNGRLGHVKIRGPPGRNATADLCETCRESLVDWWCNHD